LSNSKNKSYANLIVLILFVLLTIFSVFSHEILSKIPLSRYYILSLVTALVFLIPAIILKNKARNKASSFFRLKNFKLRWLPLTFFASLVATIGGVALNAVSLKVLPDGFKALSLNPIASVSWESPLPAILALIIVPAVFEELFFRGAYLSSFGNEKRPIIIFTGAICFAVMHSTPYNFLAPLLAGCIYGTLVYILDSVYPAIFAHLFNNAITCLFFNLNEKLSNAGLGTFLAVASIVIFLISIYVSLREIEKFIKITPKKALTVSQRVQKQKAKYVIADVYFLILIVLWALKIVLQLFKIL